MKTLATIAILVLIATTVVGEVCPIVIHLPGTEHEYTVPEGKVLLVEHAQLSSAGNMNYAYAVVQLDIPNVPPVGATATVNLSVESWWHKLATLETSLKLPGGTVIRIGPPFPKNDSLESRELTLFGQLCEPADLYAAIDCEFESINEAGDYADMMIRLGSSRPAVVTLEKTTDFKQWVDATAATVRPTLDHELCAAQAPCGEPYAFFRARARARQ